MQQLILLLRLENEDPEITLSIVDELTMNHTSHDARDHFHRYGSESRAEELCLSR